MDENVQWGVPAPISQSHEAGLCFHTVVQPTPGLFRLEPLTFIIKQGT